MLYVLDEEITGSEISFLPSIFHWNVCLELLSALVESKSLGFALALISSLCL